uniref:Bm8078 n=1 Tax=Brugia malayi TaxID=6279 RepID=A0A0H5S072_BRUMA|nr:Bm8078 [Brugia malayi]
MQVIKIDNHILTLKRSEIIGNINYNTTDLIWQSCWYILLSSFIAVVKLPTQHNQDQLSQKSCYIDQIFLASISAAEIITDYKVDKLWDDGSLIQTTQVEECMFIMKYKSRYALCAFRNISKISAETAFDGGTAEISTDYKVDRFWDDGLLIQTTQVEGSAEIITDYKVDKLWNDGSLIQTRQVEELILSNCDRMEDGRVSILEEKPLLFVRNTLNLIK